MAAVATWGRSLAVRFPKAVVEKLHLEIGDEVEFPEQGGVITIQKKARKRPTLDDLLATIPKNYQPENGWDGLEEHKGSEAW
jgi:antitoxin component of MazEF toxin-antitoxin module